MSELKEACKALWEQHQKIMRALILFLIIACLSSCAPIYYAPNAPNVPLFQKKNELSAAAAFSWGDEIKSIQIQTAYAFDSSMAIQLNGMYSIRDENFYGTYLEGAFGFFDNVSKKWILEGYIGFGAGNIYREYQTPYCSTTTRAEQGFKATFNKIFFQPSIGYTSKDFEFAFTYRLSVLNFTSVSLTNPSNISTQVNAACNTNNLNDVRNKSHSLSEPAVTFRFGGSRGVKLQTQFGASKVLFSREYEPKIYVNIGLNIKLNMKDYKE